MGAVSDKLERKLTNAFAPARLTVDDDSARHAGHAGAGPGGESHFNVLIESAAFDLFPRVYAGSFAGGWPTADSLQMLEGPSTSGNAQLFVETHPPLLTLGVSIGSQKAMSPTALVSNIGRVRLDYRP